MRTTAIQVVPVLEIPSTGYVEFQPNGPTAETTGWAVYLRQEDGTVEWFADTRSEGSAMFIGEMVACLHKVEIEHQPWVKSC